MTDTVNAIIEERAATHGDPVITHIRIAQAWSAILDHEVTAHQVALCMAALKLVRSSNNPNHQDSRDDAQGYIRIANLIAGPAEPEVNLERAHRHVTHPFNWCFGGDDCPGESSITEWVTP